LSAKVVTSALVSASMIPLEADGEAGVGVAVAQMRQGE